MTINNLQSVRGTFMLTVLITAVACRENTVLRPIEPRPLASVVHPVEVRPAQIRQFEQQFDEFARHVPSSGAYYVDEDGNLVLWVRDAEDDARARSLGNAIRRNLLTVRFRTPIHNVVVRRANYTFWQLASWRDAILEHAPTNAGWAEIDLNEAVNRVDLTIDPRYATQSHSALMEMLESIGVDTNAVRILQGRMPIPASGRRAAGADAYPTSLVSYSDTIVGGVGIKTFSGSNSAYCTIGAVLDYGGVRSFLTVSHCTKTKFQVDGDSARQAVDTGAVIGHETADPSGYNCGGHTCRGSDAAMFATEASTKSLIGLLARTQYSSSSWGGSAYYGSLSTDTSSPYFIITWASCNCAVNEALSKMGATSGWTSGYVTNTCTDIPDGDSQHWVTCAMKTTIPAYGGDSGGAVFAATSSYDIDVNFVGTVFASDLTSYSWFSPVDRIANNLTSSWNIVRGNNLSTPVVSGDVSGSIPGITWGSISGATIYQVWRQWYRYPSGTGSSGWEYLGHQTSEFWDSEMSVAAYTGTTIPNFSTEGYVEYKVVALNAADYSAQSTVKYFRLNPP